MPPSWTEDERTFDDHLESLPSAEVVAIKQELDMLKNNLSSISATMAPTVYEQSMKAIDTHLKGQGYDDFMEFRPGIEAYFNTLTIEERSALIEGDVINKYKDLKIAKMLKAKADAAVRENALRNPGPSEHKEGNMLPPTDSEFKDRTGGRKTRRKRRRKKKKSRRKRKTHRRRKRRKTRKRKH